MPARTFGALLAVLVASACVNRDDPTSVHDLRVLGLGFDPPEVMISGCDPALLARLAGAAQATDAGSVPLDPALQARLAAAASVKTTFSALIADPAGHGRTLQYRLLACASTADRQCDDEGQFVELTRGTTKEGQLDLTVTPGLQFLSGGTPLLLEVVQQDTFKGLGGIRLPVVLDLLAADTGEHIYAQKLMVYSCQFFPQQKANQVPQLQGLIFDGMPWGPSDLPQAQGTGGITIAPTSFDGLQENYLVPSLTLSPVALTETWKVNFLATSGTFANYELGGTDIGGTSERYSNKWRPDKTLTQGQDVTFYFVVRDGRGGESWVTRQAHWSP